MREPTSLLAIFNRFRSGGELRPLVCLAAMLTSGLVLAGAALATGWIIGLNRPSLVGSGVVGDVRADDVATAIWFSGALWLVLLPWIWRPAVRLSLHSRSAEGRGSSRAILGSSCVLVATVVASFLIQKQLWDGVAWAVGAVALVAGGVILLLWMPSIHRLEGPRPVKGAHGRVNVHCVECGYSMVGLDRALCPECGARYTLDELIAAQGYGNETPISTSEP